MNAVDKLIRIVILLSFFLTGCEYGDIAEIAAKKLNPSLFIAVGGMGTICYSEDGLNWTDTGNSGNDLYGVTSGGGTIVAVGSGGIILTSKDGKIWNNPHTAAATLYSVAYGNNRFVATGIFQSMVCQALYSLDGNSWVDKSSAFDYQYLYRVIFGDGLFYAMGPNTGWSTTDGESWGTCSAGTGTFRAGVYANNRYTIGADSYIVLSSTDACVTWNNANLTGTGTVPSQILGMAYGNGRYIVVGSAGITAWFVDGLNWTSVTVGAYDVNDITFGDGKFIAVGYSGYVYVTKDGINWISLTAGTYGYALNGVTYKP